MALDHYLFLLHVGFTANGLLPIFDAYPAARPNILAVKEAQHGINVRLEDFDRFSAKNPIEGTPGRGIQVLIEKEAAQSAK